MRFFRTFAILFAALLTVLVVGSIAAACPTCKTGLEDGAAGGDLISGYFWSILFMMGMPFAIVGVFSGCMYREVRKARREKQSDERIEAQNTEF